MKTKPQIVKILTLTVIFFSTLIFSYAQNTYYVSPSGTGTACSSGSPCALNTGIGKLVPGDTLYLKGGQYTQHIGNDHGESTGTANLLPDGTSSARIIVAPASGETVTIPGMVLHGLDYVTFRGDNRFIVDCKSYGFQREIGIFGTDSHVRFENLEIRNGAHQGFMGCDGGYCEFINLNVHHNGNGTCFSGGLCHGIYISHGQGHLIDGGEYHDQDDGWGIHLYNDVQSATIRNVRAYRNADRAMGAVGGNGHVRMYNNIIYDNGHNGHEGIAILNNGPSLEIYNNTIYGNNGACFYLFTGGNTVRNNICYNNGGIFDGGGAATNSNNLSTNPGFINAGSGDFHLSAGSPAIDAGFDLSAQGVITDHDGVSRPQGNAFDIGAYESGGGVSCGGPDNWVNSPFTQQTGSFSIDFDATPSASNNDAVIALSDGNAGTWTDMACIVNFNGGGTIEARNGTVYQAGNTIAYVGGTTYHIRMDVNINTKTYSIYVTPAGGTQQPLGLNYAFRSEQNAVTKLNNITKHTDVCTVDIKNLNIAVTTNISTDITILPVINISPNPSSGIFTLYTSFEKAQNIKVEIKNVLGEEVFKVQGLKSEVKSIDISHLPNGIYFWEVVTDGQTQVQKIIKH